MGDTAGRGGPAPPATIYGAALGELDQIDQVGRDSAISETKRERGRKPR